MEFMTFLGLIVLTEALFIGIWFWFKERVAKYRLLVVGDFLPNRTHKLKYFNKRFNGKVIYTGTSWHSVLNPIMVSKYKKKSIYLIGNRDKLPNIHIKCE